MPGFSDIPFCVLITDGSLTEIHGQAMDSLHLSRQILYVQLDPLMFDLIRRSVREGGLACYRRVDGIRKNFLFRRPYTLMPRRLKKLPTAVLPAVNIGSHP